MLIGTQSSYYYYIDYALKWYAMKKPDAYFRVKLLIVKKMIYVSSDHFNNEINADTQKSSCEHFGVQVE